MKVRTDHKWKNFKYRNEVPESVLNDYFEHLPDEMDGFIHYARRWWHTSDFLRIDGGDFGTTWQGVSSDTYFSGAVIEISNDGEHYRIGYYFS